MQRLVTNTIFITGLCWLLFSGMARGQAPTGDTYGDDFANPGSRSPLQGELPENYEIRVELDSTMRTYTIYQKVGDLDWRPVSKMTFQEFAEWQRKEKMREHWKNPDPFGGSGDTTTPQIKFQVGGDEDPVVEIIPSGNVTLDFGARFQRVDNPAIPVRQQRSGGFDFDQQISMNVLGTIGDRLKLTANWDTKATFDFDNNIKIDFQGKDVDIIQSLEAGNVSFPLKNSLIRGAQNLFGVKAQMKFGKLGVTTLMSSQRSRTESIVLKGGAQTREFSIRSSDYDEGRHYFLSQYFRDLFPSAYNSNAKKLNPNSGFRITRLEVYKTNSNTRTQDTRNILGFLDLGEFGDNIYNDSLLTTNPAFRWTANGANDLLDIVRTDSTFRQVVNTESEVEGKGFRNGIDYEVVKSALKLQEGVDYTFHPELGFVSLTTSIQPDEALAVAFEYSYFGQSYKVGELTEDYQNFDENAVIILKLLKPQSIQTSLPYWDLMMKNIYSLNTGNLNQDNFQMRVIYRDDFTGIDNPSLREGQNFQDVPLLQIFGMDELNMVNEFVPDGNFDYIEGATILADRGKVIFPQLEPFGDFLESQFTASEASLKSKYVYDELYDKIQREAETYTQYDKFELQGTYQSASAKTIMLPGINISPGSVIITAGSAILAEGRDYTVDYNLGRVTIKNEGILLSADEIRIEYEKSDLFNFRTKSLFGTRLDYAIGKNFNVGGTWLMLNERPLLTRVNIGDEPRKNHQFGFDVNYKDKSRIVTKIVDALPGISTKEEADVSLNWEVAGLVSGVSKITKGASYVDDFEGAETPFDLTRAPTRWNIGSTPQRFPESDSDSLPFAYKRAKLAWYNIDNSFYLNNNTFGTEPEDFADRYVRLVNPQEVFPGRDNQQFQTNQFTFDLAYYPSERGPYNYNPSNLDFDENNRFRRPEESFAAITRAITSNTNFNEINVQFIEFWMMNPFIESGLRNNTSGGELYFNLGDVSEDVMKDSRHAFENGLPENVEENEWGRVTTQQFLTNAFDNSVDRDLQDVGFDGLNSQEEAEYFGSYIDQLTLTGQARSLLQADPSSDNFEYYATDEDDPRNPLERYKNFNGQENNSPTNSGGGDFTPSSTTIPDNEDLNRDNTISTAERYYEYKLDLKPNNMRVGGNKFIVDQLDSAGQASWLQFRIPIQDATVYEEFGDPDGFQTIKFLRLYMTGWSEPVVIRLVQFQLVAAQWRFLNDFSVLSDASGGVGTEPCNTSFNVGTVNIEENSTGSVGETSPYVIHDDIIRDQDNTTTIVRQLNEQSLALSAQNLCDGEGRGVFKNTGFDFINYENLNLFIHAETTDPNTRDGDLNAILRFGTDDNHYYEVRRPLFFSDLSGSNREDPDEVWRDENEIDIPFSYFIAAKRERDEKGFPNTEPYETTIDGWDITVKGIPDYSSVQKVTIGIKNPKDDGQPKSARIWVNELRVTGFNRKAGGASRLDFATTLPGLGNFNASGKFIGVNYGNIEDRIADRSRSNQLDMSMNTNLNMHEFLPDKWGLKLPLYMSWSKALDLPKFDPLNPDVELANSVELIDEDQRREEYKKQTRSQTTTKSINITNAQKVTTNPEAKKRIYSPDNFTVSAGYSETKASGVGNPDVGRGNALESYLEQRYTGALGYQYNFKPKPIEPFKNVGLLNSKYLKLIKDFNFSLLPSQISLRGDINRRYTKTQLYTKIGTELTTFGVQPTYEKSYTFDRTHGVRWNLTKSLSFGYSSTAKSLIDEPRGDKLGDDDFGTTKESYRDSLIENLKKLGRIKNFSQNIDATYQLPLSSIPLIDWIDADVSYRTGYNWNASALGLVDSSGFNMGNIISNSSDWSVNSKLNLVKFYNKIPFLQKINTPPRTSRKSRKQLEEEAAAADTVKKSLAESKIFKAIFRSIMIVRNINFRGSLNSTTIIPGFLPSPSFMGMNGFGGAPGLPFILGSQDAGILREAASKGWYSQSPTLNNPFVQTRALNYSVRASLEPLEDFRVQVDAKREKSSNYSEIFRVDTTFFSTSNLDYISLSPLRNGGFSTSFIALRSTSFLDLGGNKSEEVFSQFEGNRSTVKNILDGKNSNGGAYGINSQDVLIPSFLAAYGGGGVKGDKLALFPAIPLPNWRVDYAGLGKLKSLKKKFSSINLTHAYQSGYTIGSYTTSLEYGDEVVKPSEGFVTLDGDFDGRVNTEVAAVNESGNYIAPFIINEVNITERFSPLVGINVRTRERINIKLEYKTERNLNLSLANTQLTEINNKDIVIGFGWTKKGLKLGIKKSKPIIDIPKTKDITFKIDMSFRDTKTTQRTIDGPDVVTAGNISFRLNPNINYVVSRQLNLQLFFDRTFNEPRVSSSFRRSSTAFGVRLRFSLQ